MVPKSRRAGPRTGAVPPWGTPRGGDPTRRQHRWWRPSCGRPSSGHATSISTLRRSRRVCDGAWWRSRVEPSARARMRRSMRRAEAGWCVRATWRRRGACRHPVRRTVVGYYRVAGREAGRTPVKRPRTVLARCVVGVSWCAPVRVRAHGTSPLSPHAHVHVSPASHVCVRLSLSCAGPAWTLARPRWCALPGGVGTGPVRVCVETRSIVGTHRGGRTVDFAVLCRALPRGPPKRYGPPEGGVSASRHSLCREYAASC